MRNNSRSNVEVKAEGTPAGADEMMRIEARGSFWLKVLGGLSLFLGSFSALVLVLHRSGLI